jgi:hypothetical protein
MTNYNYIKPKFISKPGICGCCKKHCLVYAMNICVYHHIAVSDCCQADAVTVDGKNITIIDLKVKGHND